MANKRKTVNETEDQKVDRLHREAISNHATRSEKTSWNRKRVNLDKYVQEKLHPLEHQILDLQLQLRPFYDEVKVMRTEMVDTCVHPYDLLVSHDSHMYCKFCNKQLAKPTA